MNPEVFPALSMVLIRDEPRHQRSSALSCPPTLCLPLHSYTLIYCEELVLNHFIIYTLHFTHYSLHFLIDIVYTVCCICTVCSVCLYFSIYFSIYFSFSLVLCIFIALYLILCFPLLLGSCNEGISPFIINKRVISFTCYLGGVPESSSSEPCRSDHSLLI